MKGQLMACAKIFAHCCKIRRASWAFCWRMFCTWCCAVSRSISRVGRTWAAIHVGRKLDLCYGSTGRSDRNRFLESKSQQHFGWTSQAKSFSADLGGNKSNHSSLRQQSRLQTKSSLRLDSQYNVAFIHVQTVLRKRYISRYVS